MRKPGFGQQRPEPNSIPMLMTGMAMKNVDCLCCLCPGNSIFTAPGTQRTGNHDPLKVPVIAWDKASGLRPHYKSYPNQLDIGRMSPKLLAELLHAMAGNHAAGRRAAAAAQSTEQ